MSKHSQSSKFTASGIFKGLNSFTELEARISALSLEKDRGDAFEVFAEAYLATQPICQSKHIWPQTSAPSTLLISLGLPVSRDMGTDGLVELKDGRIASYQAKFYTGRPSLNWSLLSTFFAISDRVAHTIIFTNSDTLASTIEQRQNFISIRGTDLDRLTPDNFAIIEEWLKGEPVVRAIPKPRPHQEKALCALLPALESSDRATVIMACGTGKTLLSLWTAERLKAKNVLVLVPSLALIQQTLHGWLAATGLDNLTYLCVCCDPTVTDGADELVVKKSDLDFEVTTSPTDVKHFLESEFPGVKIVFSTYMSAAVVGEALKGRNIFDLGIFDEAHKTAGRENKAYAFALSDGNLPLKKRVFMTATPRHYNVLKRDKEGDAKLVYSMDIPESYGPVVHKLSFAQAAKDDIISRYKVLISVVTSEMVRKELLSRGKVIVDGDEIHAHQVANQLALAAAVEKHQVKKIISFHKNIKSAQSFTAPGSEGISSHLEHFSAFHVNGAMSSAEREKLMGEFKNSALGLVSNAKCLTEGVDVPAVDMVAFLSPKRSTVDIVQATGRAMRKAPDKEFGYILVPLYLEIQQGETIEGAVQRGDFEEVWDVLAALQEQDEVLADTIQKMREDLGRIKGFDDSRFRDQVEIIGPELALEELRKAITVDCIERLGSCWDERYGELLRFKAVHGHYDVPWKDEKHRTLNIWCAAQRMMKRTGKLLPAREKRLEQIGFEWTDGYVDVWDTNINALLEFKKTNGHCNVPQKYPNNPSLGLWVANNRRLGKSGKLSKDRIDKLNSIGFAWDPRQDDWMRNYRKLEEYFSKYGHSNIPQKWPENPDLALWVALQRQFKKLGRVSDENTKLLEKLNFEWDRHDLNWENHFKELVAFKTANGHCGVSAKYPGTEELRIWVTKQRALKKKGQLPEDRITRLNEIGFIWAAELDWEKYFGELLAFKDKYGHCDLSYKYPCRLELCAWAAKQRKLKKEGLLSKDLINRLEDIGFLWDVA
jgi:superfamily II DNA or RNA helicase